MLPPKGAYVNVHAELMAYFAKNLWRRIWDAVSREIEEECDVEGDIRSCLPEKRLEHLDKNNDGIISVEEIKDALQDLVGLSVDDRELSLAKFVHAFADTNGSGQVTVEDFETFCNEMTEVYERDAWRLAYPKPTLSGTGKENKPII
jgi:hypothetical protein